MQSLQDGFSVARFLRLCRTNIQSNWKSLSLYAGITGLVCILFVYHSSIPETGNIPYFAYDFLSFIMISLLLGLSSHLASSSVGHLKKRDSACHELMLPAKRIEKYAATIVLQGIVIPVLLCLSVIFAAYALYIFSGSFRVYINTLDILSAFVPTKFFIVLGFSFFLNQTFFIAGASFFKKRPMLKLILIGLGLLILSAILSANLFGDFNPMDLVAEFVDRALFDTGYNQEFWVVSGFLVGISLLFSGFSWRYFSRHVMP